jgi:hypothetical protein
MFLCCEIAKLCFVPKKNEIEVFEFLTHNISFPYPIKKNIFSDFSSKYTKNTKNPRKTTTNEKKEQKIN